MPPPKLPQRLPPLFFKFFWDVDAKKINPSQKPMYVINRLLDKGDLAAARWVIHNFPEELIVETVKNKRDFSLNTVTFWANYLNIPMEEIKCMQAPYRHLHRLHWLS